MASAAATAHMLAALHRMLGTLALRLTVLLEQLSMVLFIQ
jgi:hypothetical protein